MTLDRREIRATALGLAIVLPYVALVCTNSRIDLIDLAALFGLYLSGATSLWILIAVAAAPCLLYRRRRDPDAPPSPFRQIEEWLRARWARDRFASLIWPPLLFALLMASFNAYKQMILPMAGFRFDPLFAAMDHALFLGTDPWRITHRLLPWPQASLLIDRAYHGWFVPMSLGVIVCAFLPARSWRVRTQYLLSYVAIWIGIGSALAFLLPAAGPCFYGNIAHAGDHFALLMAKLTADQAAAGGAFAALANQAMLVSGHGADGLMAGGGISAMPSVHNALAVLFAITAFHIHRFAGWLMTGYALLIWIGSIHLGWHYAIDGIVAAILTIMIWRGAGIVADRLERGQIAPARPIAVVS